MADDARLFYPATERNREPIAAVLERWLPDEGLVLEIASGSGEHAAHLAPRFPRLTWQPSDPSPRALASIAAWREHVGAPNLREPVRLDVCEWPWPVDRAEVVMNVNMIHIAPREATGALLAGASEVLGPGGVLYMYGPYRVGGEHTAPSNASFDRSLRDRDPRWGVRDLDAVIRLAEEHGLVHQETVEMPANNLSVLFRRR